MQIDTKRVLRRIELRLTEIDMEKGEFYAKSGISSGSYSQWNTEAHQPSLKKLRAAASVLGVSLEYLLYGDGAEKESAPATEGEGLSGAKKALLVAIDDLSDAQCEKLLPIVLSAKQVL
nr:MAG TPA: transcriptional repressor DicA [Caudoviricetes sp.]